MDDTTRPMDLKPCTINSDVVTVLLSAIDSQKEAMNASIKSIGDSLNEIRNTIVTDVNCHEHRLEFARRMGQVETISREFDFTKEKLLTKDEAINMFSSKADLNKIMEKLECMDRKLVLLTSVVKLINSIVKSKYATVVALAFVGTMLMVFNMLYTPLQKIFSLLGP